MVHADKTKKKQKEKPNKLISPQFKRRLLIVILTPIIQFIFRVFSNNINNCSKPDTLFRTYFTTGEKMLKDLEYEYLLI
jgi:hypothetical protein